MVAIMGFVAIAILSIIVCLMWVYTAIQVQKEDAEKGQDQNTNGRKDKKVV